MRCAAGSQGRAVRAVGRKGRVQTGREEEGGGGAKEETGGREAWSPRV